MFFQDLDAEGVLPISVICFTVSQAIFLNVESDRFHHFRNM